MTPASAPLAPATRHASRSAELSDWLGLHRERRFDWSTWNCCHFAAGWVRHATGRDLMAGLPTTPDPAAAAALIERLAGTLPALWSQWLGAPITPALARAGDVVMIVADGATTAALCTGRHAVGLHPQRGLVFVPMRWAATAWRLPA